MTLLLLAVVAVAESLAFVWRYSAAYRGSPLHQGLSTLIVSTLRVLFVALGVGAAMAAVPVWAVIGCYAVPAGLATWGVAALGAARLGRQGGTPTAHDRICEK